MDEHTSKCIRYFESLATAYEKEAEENEKRYAETGPEDIMHYRYYDKSAEQRSIADAYRTCVAALSDPKYFERMPKG